MKELLKQIESGVTSFRPINNDLPAFQITVEKLSDAYESGFITKFKPHKESQTGKRYFDAVMASGLTDEGREFLAN